MKRFAVPVLILLSFALTACFSGRKPAPRYSVTVEDVGGTVPVATLVSIAATSAPSALGCVGYTYTHIPTEASGLEDHYNTRYVRATVSEDERVLQDAAVSWAVDEQLVRVLDERDSLLAIVPHNVGEAHLIAAYEGTTATQTVYIYDAATIGASEGDIVGFDLDGDGFPDVEVTIGSTSFTQRMRFSGGASVVSGPVDYSGACVHHSEEVARFHQLRELPSEAAYNSDWQRATTGTYVVRTSGGDHYKVLVGSMGIRSGTLTPNEITLGIQYLAADEQGHFPY